MESQLESQLVEGGLQQTLIENQLEGGWQQTLTGTIESQIERGW